jgi:hypothetical protein
MTAAAGIGQGAAAPAPQPASSPVRTDSGMLMPQGWPGRSSRIATALPATAAPANASAAVSSARSGSALIRCSCPSVPGGISAGLDRDGRWSVACGHALLAAWLGGARLDESGLVGGYYGLDAVPGAELGQDPGDVGSHRGLADYQFRGDLGVG